MSNAYFTDGAPSSGTITTRTKMIGVDKFKTTIKLDAARVPITDATTSGSYGTLKLGTLINGAIAYGGAVMDFTAFAEGSALTTAAGDAAFAIGVGTSAIATAADGTLATANKDITGSLSCTNSGGTTTGRAAYGAGGYANGTSTAATLNLNVSGSAATIDATSYLDVTGTIVIIWQLVADL